MEKIKKLTDDIFMMNESIYCKYCEDPIMIAGLSTGVKYYDVFIGVYDSLEIEDRDDSHYIGDDYVYICDNCSNELYDQDERTVETLVRLCTRYERFDWKS